MSRRSYPTARTRRSREAGFTLSELLAVVAIVGILAVLGVAGFRDHVYSSKSVEAYAMIQSIRAAQERWRAETLGYLDVSRASGQYYPIDDVKELGKQRYTWQQAASTHPDADKWKVLNPTVTGPVMFGYKVFAGAPGTTPNPIPDLRTKPTFGVSEEPWYIIEAVADADGDGDRAAYAATSINGTVYAENEGE